MNYKRAQKKDLTERLVLIENEKTVSSRKAQILIEENKSLQTDIRVKEREI